MLKRNDLFARTDRSTKAIEFSVHFFNRLFFPVSFSYGDTENTYVFSMSVSDVFVRKILIDRYCKNMSS